MGCLPKSPLPLRVTGARVARHAGRPRVRSRNAHIALVTAFRLVCSPGGRNRTSASISSLRNSSLKQRRPSRRRCRLRRIRSAAPPRAILVFATIGVRRSRSSDGPSRRHGLAHLPDQLSDPPSVGLRFRRVEPAAPTTVTLAPRWAGAPTPVNAASTVRHRRRLAYRPTPCPCAAPIGNSRSLQPAQPEGIARLIYRFFVHPPPPLVAGPEIAPTMTWAPGATKIRSTLMSFPA
jgi:hypothetical protein